MRRAGVRLIDACPFDVADANDGVPDQAAWEHLRRREIGLATIDERCRRDADLDGEYARLCSDAERRFVIDHRAELDAMMVWISEHSS